VTSVSAPETSTCKVDVPPGSDRVASGACGAAAEEGEAENATHERTAMKVRRRCAGLMTACYSTAVLRASEFDFVLPEALIASEPPSVRDGARLLVIGDAPQHAQVRDLADWLEPGSLLVVNDTRVVPARLFAEKPTGGRVELLLCDRLSVEGKVEIWRAMAASSKPMRAGTLQIRGDSPPSVEVLDAAPPYVTVRLTPPAGETLEQSLDRVGEMPLPPYIVKAREALGGARASLQDRTRYQTVFAEHLGAVAAPTAGLHLSEALLAKLAARDIERAAITLHVGPGTFAPLRSDVLDENRLHAEQVEISEQVAERINAARRAKRPIVAVGTTVVRALEGNADGHGHVRAASAPTDLFIKPGYRFSVVDRLLSNFHLPRSSLLVLVAAFAGKDRVLHSYREAVNHGYRFYSYGDATLSSRADR
jgi:S-adenosylmethionine:tRNA ribosyltransferase-isomerase